jgi:hypothetical protein
VRDSLEEGSQIRFEVCDYAPQRGRVASRASRATIRRLFLRRPKLCLPARDRRIDPFSKL